MLSTGSPYHRYFIELAYNGAGFHGWQTQPGAVTIQEILNDSLSILNGSEVYVVGCGRTDSGVHASHFVAHFDMPVPVQDCRLLASRLNRFLPVAVRIDRIEKVGQESHARFSATARTYHYLLSKRKNPFMADFSWELHIPLDIGIMNRASARIRGRHDFTSFSKLHTDVKTNICEVYEAEWIETVDFLVFRIRADRFLRNMVRALVGTMIEAGKGKSPENDVDRILVAKNRSEAGMSVPARGLFLTKVDYPDGIFRVDPRSPFPGLITVI